MVLTTRVPADVIRRRVDAPAGSEPVRHDVSWRVRRRCESDRGHGAQRGAEWRAALRILAHAELTLAARCGGWRGVDVELRAVERSATVRGRLHAHAHSSSRSDGC